METIRVTVYTLNENEWLSENPVNIEFEGTLLVSHSGNRGEAFVYQTRKKQLAIIHDHSGVNGKVLQIHQDLTDVARYTDGYTRVKTPWYDQSLIEEIAQALGDGLPTQKLDI